MSNVKFVDNSQQAKRYIENSINKALVAIGQAAVEITVNYMNNKYGKPIYQTGDLIRSITFDADIAGKRVIIGSNLNYAPWVHFGTAKMLARPFLRDALLENVDVWKELVEEQFGKGWTVSVAA